MPAVTRPRVLITGASGNYAQQLIRTLCAGGTEPSTLILVSRNPASLQQHAAIGCETRQGSFDDPVDRLATAFTGADVVFMISTSRAGARIPQHQNAINAAVQAGVRQMIYTSYIGADLADPTALVVREHRATETMLRQSGLQWTALRDSMYSEALTDVAAPIALREHALRSNAGQGLVAFISRNDCVRAAAAVVANPAAHANKVYNITGPELMTWGDAARAMSQATQVQVEYEYLDDEESYAVFDGMGIPREPGDEFEKNGVQGYHWNSNDMVSFGRAMRGGEMAVVSRDVELLTGQPAQTFLQIAQARLAPLAC